MTERELFEMLSAIAPADRQAMDAAAKRQAELAKPPGSLGKLETISVRLAGITGKVKNELGRCRVAVFAADNGVVREGVAVTPQSVTLAQSINMTRHITGMSSIAAFFGNDVRVIDVGIDSEHTPDGILNRKIARGTGNIAEGPAMTREQCLAAIAAGVEAADTAKKDGVDALGIGEMGIGNTTTAAAVLSALTGAPAETVTGFGSGLTDEAFQKKVRVVDRAARLNAPDPGNTIGVLASVGGFDLAAMTGAYLGCAKNRIPAVADGFISVTAALAAFRLCPAVKDFIFLSHASKERGCRLVYEQLGLQPMLLLDMRLGEGSGCPIAFQVMRAACAAMNGMATFPEAAIDDGYLAEIRGKDF